MRLFFDTSVIVDLERGRKETVSLLDSATRARAELWTSTIVVSEILTGAYLRRDADAAVLRAKHALGQFVWQEFDGEAAEKTGQLLAYLYAEGKPIQYQDAAIAASAIVAKADVLVTENRKHFTVFPRLAPRVLDAVEMRATLRKGKT